MNEEYRQLVERIGALTGAAPPAVLQEDAPVLARTVLRGPPEMYLVGLIGGKDVGKSSVVNALVGQEITARTSHGPGTETVIAYAHEDQARELESLLKREVPGQYQIVSHRIESLRRQVLLDLPDIDSHYDSHMQITRRMLRHMLYPIWIQSVEKYADRRPQELLAQVAAGNAPENFIFCLNKVDQLAPPKDRSAGDQPGGAETAARELAADYANRIARVLGLDSPPRVWLISAAHPGDHDLPALRELLSRQRGQASVDSSLRSAARQQDLTIARWVARQDLGRRLEETDRLLSAAEAQVADRLAAPLVDVAARRILDDPAYRIALADELMNCRVTRWPIVNLVQVLMGPLLSVLRLRLPMQQQRALAGPEELVDVHLSAIGAARQPLGALVQSTFASLHQSSPLMARLYGQNRLWESQAAESAATELRRRLAQAVQQQQEMARRRMASGRLVGALPRLLLTIGAVVWFPFAQPLLEAWLSPGREMLLLAVQLLGVTYLLKNVGFLAIWFTVLWLALKWNTQRKLDRWLATWKQADALEPQLSLAGQVMEWSGQLLEPLRSARRQLADLLEKARSLEMELRGAQPSGGN